MLIIGRKHDERIWLDLPSGERITLTVVEVRGPQGQVRIGIDAPLSVKVNRPDAIRNEPRSERQ